MKDGQPEAASMPDKEAYAGSLGLRLGSAGAPAHR